MTAGADAPPFSDSPTIPTDDDSIFGFFTSNWIEPPPFDPKPSETDKERYDRIFNETKYRHDNNPTSWNRYCTLGRYAVSGDAFNAAWNEFGSDPIVIHSIVWYNYMYHFERQMDIPIKLQAWASKISQAYLATHFPTMLTTLDTQTTPWATFAESHGLSTKPWTPVGPKKGRRTRSSSAVVTPASRPFQRPSTMVNPPATIRESQLPIDLLTPQHESELDNSTATSDATPPRGNQTQAKSTTVRKEQHHPAPQDKRNDDISRASSDGKRSALIPNLNVPVNDGTYRVTLRWKTDIETLTASRNETTLATSIHSLLNDIFNDNDGSLYQWQYDGLEHSHHISQMSPSEIRSYICPSIPILMSQSMIIIPLRFGFTGKTPATWRNKSSTKAALAKNNLSVSISNAKSTSGRLVIAGYVLLKSPIMTHRIRYLQHLRSTLPDSTPPFDLLLHRRTPLDQDISHIVVQCGEHHVHSVGQALLDVLTGDRSPIYVPRHTFADMTQDEIKGIFETHDTYVKSLKSIPLWPTFSNIDTIRSEHSPNGPTVDRTIREWSRTIKTSDGLTFAQCDVINGGSDQKAYLLVQPQHYDAANDALQKYKKQIFPFNQREARFREGIGPPSVIHVNPKIVANLNFLATLSKAPAWAGDQNADTVLDSDTTTSNRQGSEHSDVSMDSEQDSLPPDSLPKKPMTPLESLQQQYQQRSSNMTASTSSNSVSNKSRQSTMSTSSARFYEMEARLTRQQDEFNRKEKISSDRLMHIERQLRRIDDVDSKLDSFKTDINTALDQSRAAQASDVRDMNDKMIVLMRKQSGFSDSINGLSDKIASLVLLISNPKNISSFATMQNHDPYASPSEASVSSDLQSTQNTKADGDESMPASRLDDMSLRSGTSKSSSSAESSKVHSPEKKKQKSQRVIEVDDIDLTMDINSDEDEHNEIDDASPSMDCQNSDTNSQNDQQATEDTTTDQESQNLSKSSLGGGSPS